MSVAKNLRQERDQEKKLAEQKNQQNDQVKFILTSFFLKSLLLYLQVVADEQISDFILHCRFCLYRKVIHYNMTFTNWVLRNSSERSLWDLFNF